MHNILPKKKQGQFLPGFIKILPCVCHSTCTAKTLSKGACGNINEIESLKNKSYDNLIGAIKMR